MVNRNVLPRFGLLALLLAIQASPLPAHADPETSRPMMQGVKGAYRFSPRNSVGSFRSQHSTSGVWL